MEALAEARTFVSARDLHRLLAARGNAISLSSVYRALSAMDDSVAERLPSPSGEMLYRPRTSPTDCVLSCVRCRASVIVSEPGIGAWARRVALDNAYVLTRVRAVLSGLCADCSAAAGADG